MDARVARDAGTNARAHRRQCQPAVPRRDDVRRLGRARPRRRDPHHPPRARRGDQLHRHGRRLLARRVRGDRRQGARGGRRENVVLATKFHGTMGEDPNQSGNSRRWIMHGGRGLAEAPADRLDRPLPGAPLGPETDIEETLGALSTSSSGQGPLHRLLDLPGGEIVNAQWIARDRRLERFVCEQPPYSILARGIEADVLPRAGARHGRDPVEPARRRLALRPLAQGCRGPTPVARR